MVLRFKNDKSEAGGSPRRLFFWPTTDARGYSGPSAQPAPAHPDGGDCCGTC